MYQTVVLLTFLAIGSYARNWDYTFVGLETDIKVDFIQSDVKLERIARSEYAVNGSFSLDKDISGSYKLFASVLKSRSENGDYKPVPFVAFKQDLNTFFNGHYKNVVMEDLHKCSNMPFFEDSWKEPFQAGKYDLNMCLLDPQNWPDNVPVGFYKIIMDVVDEEGKGVATITVVVQVE